MATTVLRILSGLLIVAGVGLIIFHFATDIGQDQEAARWILPTGIGLGLAVVGCGKLHERQARATRL